MGSDRRKNKKVVRHREKKRKQEYCSVLWKQKIMQWGKAEIWIEICTTCASCGQWPHLCAGQESTNGWGLPAKSWLWRKMKSGAAFGREFCSSWNHLETYKDCESCSLFICRALKVDGRWMKFTLWLFHSTAKPAFYLCLCEIIHLCSNTVLFVFFPWLSYCRAPKIHYQTSNSTYAQRGGDTCFHLQPDGDVNIPMEGSWCSGPTRPLEDRSVSQKMLSVRCGAVWTPCPNENFIPSSVLPWRERHAGNGPALPISITQPRTGCAKAL